MVSKSQKSGTEKGSGSRKVFDNEDVIELLAWVDICMNHQTDFKSTIEQRFADTRNASNRQGPPIGYRQAQSKLCELGRIHGPEHVKSKSSYLPVLKQGTSYLTRLPSNMKEAIATRLSVYDERHEGQNFSIPIASFNPACISASGNMRENGESEKHPVPNPQSPKFMPPTTGGLESNGELHPPRNHNHVATVNEQSLKSLMDGSARDLQVVPTKREYEAEIHGLEELIENVRTEWHNEVYELSQQLSESIKAERDIKAKLKHREMSEKSLKEGGREDMMFYFIDQNYALKHRVQEMKSINHFCQRNSREAKAKIQQDVDEAVRKISSEVEGVLHGHKVVIGNPNLETNHDLGNLVHCVYKKALKTNDINPLLSRDIAKYGSQPAVIVGSLISAALHSWVFHTDFPNFAAVQHPLIDAFRQVVRKYDGIESARNLEIAAYHVLKDKPSFKDSLIPNKAAELADRLERVLHPLFRNVPGGSASSKIGTWGQSTEVCRSRKQRLIGIFTAALKLKVASVTADNLFEYLVYQPGSKKSDDTSISQVHSPASFEQNHPWTRDDTWTIGLLHIYRTSTTVNDNLIPEALLNYKNFVERNAVDREKHSLYQAPVHIPTANPKNSRVNWVSANGLDTNDFNSSQRGMVHPRISTTQSRALQGRSDTGITGVVEDGLLYRNPTGQPEKRRKISVGEREFYKE